NGTRPVTCVAEVTSATGQLVLTQRLIGSQDNLNVRALSPGVYQLRLISTDGVIGMQRLVVN
ncbi:MAG TPA: T9SS type A sorting domain-containing protein, partial [Flavobacteriales bacterium]|nr:T9SS type A sorting domain-containing protein [Flavobacteriales bacterium]